MDMLYGRHRRSIVDIEGELLRIFYEHPESHENDHGQPVIPAHHLVDVFRTYSENHDGLELITTEEEEQLNQLIESNPGLEVTPQVLLEFIAMRAAAKAHEEAEAGNSHNESEQQEGQEREEESGSGSDGERGRSEYWEGRSGYHSRSSSEDSAGTSVYRSRPPSRGPPLPPKTPSNPSTPFDASRRQRTTPLGPPSSWTAKRPTPASRRRSVDGGHSRAMSDSEFTSDSPSSHSNRSGRRSRAPSNPSSPKSHSTPTLPTLDSFTDAPPSSFSRPPSRPQSRSESRTSQRSNSFGSRMFRTPSPHGDDPRLGPGITPPSPEIDISSHVFRRRGSQQQDAHEDLSHGVNSLPMPRGSDSDDSDSDNEDRTLGLVMDRSAASSLVSLEPNERLEALQKTNQEMGRKLMEAERMLQLRLNEHELELEEMQGRLEEAKSELSATKREEKELRAKEKQNSSQILALESEIAKLQKSLDNSRTAYQSLQKQYQEQCAESERYRNALRRRDEEIKDLQEASALQSLEAQKLLRESDNYEERINFLEAELVAAQQTHAQLEEQKQENMLLKETIDRMRFDMDELRTSATSHTQGASGTGASAKNTISKSLGAELLGKMKDVMWSGDEEEEESGNEGEESEATTAVEETESSGTEGEDVIQTIITRTKKRVARSGKVEKVNVQEVKEYTEEATQYEPSEFFACGSTQTDPEPKVFTASTDVQTEAPPAQGEIQTETEPLPAPVAKVTVDVDVQTDLVAAAVSTHDEDALASSSSTASPPTPKALVPDLPPSYSQTQEDEKALRIAAETLHKWHPGVTGPFETVATGVSEDAIEEWKALKKELGVDCIVIDKIIEDSPKTGENRSPKDHKRRKSGRFYNIYNTYVYGSKDGNDSSIPGGVATQVLLCVGVSALCLLAMRPMIAPHAYVHTGPSYYDRMAWNSFNAMYPHAEGFSPDGTAAVWNLFGRLGGGAARIARGWPT
ncbi:hypothetical protein OE88DRAFT_1702542 [Heliocybe sulcata]|uniref:Uncharacterized protein n=1 Tax=Heliocybe sulcata TaxID=5364 RepID=A0A5C3N110_9AGAM|nr:hypothetical protein OE88DRAFT_1702542 [Heliocybe sulcata]